MEKLDYLIEYLLKESGRGKFDYSNRDKKSLYRALVNIRQANLISEDFLKVEDEYLQEELKKQSITNTDDIKAKNRIALWHGDITKLKIDAIVNAGNSQGLGCFLPNHNCIDNQINTFAGVRLRLACNEIMKDLNYNLETGKAIITKGYNLPSKYIIQTVGPIIENEVTEEKKQELADCYINSLKLAVDNGIKTIAFPCISTGVFRFPKDNACITAIKSVKGFLENNNIIEKVVFSVYSDEDLEIYKNELK